MATLGLVNIGALVTGRLADPRSDADVIFVSDGRIAAIGAGAGPGAASGKVVFNAPDAVELAHKGERVVLVRIETSPEDLRGMIAADGILTSRGGVSSHAALVARQMGKVCIVGCDLTFMSAAAKCFANFHPNGMKVNAGSVILEPGLTDADFAEMARHGVRHAKYGFGGYRDPRDGEPEVRQAQKHGLCVMSHSGGTSIPGSSPISHEVLLHLRPDVCGHVNGGTTSLDEAGLEEIVATTDMALQIVQAGNLRSALHILDLARTHGAMARVCLASDTPTGTGVMPMGVLKSVCELASLGDLAPAEAIALATGNNRSAFRLMTGTIAVGEPADLVVCDAPVASAAADALGAIARGDIPGISAVIIDGEVRVGRSRNTPLAKRLATFSGVHHLTTERH